MRGRMGSLGSLVDRLHVSLAWPEAAGICAACFFSESQPDRTNEAEPHGKKFAPVDNSCIPDLINIGNGDCKVASFLDK